MFRARVDQDELWPAEHAEHWLTTPREAFALWLSRHQALSGLPVLRDTTLDTYDGMFLAWNAFIKSKSLSLFNADGFAAIAFFDKSALAPISKRRYLQLLEKLYDYFVSQGWAPGNPFRLIAPRAGVLDPLEVPPPEWLSEREQRTLVSVLQDLDGWRGDRDRALAALLMGAGLRVSEARSLRLLDVEPRTWSLTLTPGGVHRPHTTRVLPDGPWSDWLQTWLTVRTGVFPGQWVLCATAKGTALSASTIFRRVDGWLAAAGIHQGSGQRGPNLLRNTFARAALASGQFSVDDVKEFMGHHELRATLRHLPDVHTAETHHAG